MWVCCSVEYRDTIRRLTAILESRTHGMHEIVDRRKVVLFGHFARGIENVTSDLRPLIKNPDV